MKNLKLLVASIIAVSLINSSSQARIEGTYINLGLGEASLQDKLNLSFTKYVSGSMSFGTEYIFNYKSILISLELEYRFINLKQKEKIFNKFAAYNFINEKLYSGFNRNQFLFKLDLGYALNESFGLFINVGITVQDSKNVKIETENTHTINNIGFNSGLAARCDLSKNWSLKFDMNINRVGLNRNALKILREFLEKNTPEYGASHYRFSGYNKLEYKLITLTISYKF